MLGYFYNIQRVLNKTSAHDAGGAEPVSLGHVGEGGAQAVHVERLVALVTQQQVVLPALLTADLALLHNTKQHLTNIVMFII